MKHDLNKTVHEFLKDHPSAMDVFIERKMLCIGCPAQAFHTLSDVEQLYGYDRKSFLEILDKAVRNVEQKKRKDKKPIINK